MTLVIFLTALITSLFWALLWALVSADRNKAENQQAHKVIKGENK